MASDANLPAAPRAFGGITLAINVESEAAVDAAIEAAVAGGATILKPARTEWGGYSGCFADPDGYPWEVAFSPFFAIGADGRMAIP